MPTASLLGAFLRAIGVGLIEVGITAGEAAISGQKLFSHIPVSMVIVVAYALILTGRDRQSATQRLRGEITVNVA